MPHHPVHFEFDAMQPSPAAEAAARRRLRALESAFPIILESQVRLEAAPTTAADGAYFAQAEARIVGNALVRAQARGSDVLGALRLAFNALEGQLEEEREGARSRAARWLLAVRNRASLIAQQGAR